MQEPLTRPHLVTTATGYPGCRESECNVPQGGRDDDLVERHGVSGAYVMY